MILFQDTHLWCLWHLNTNYSCKLWSSTIWTPKQETNELCCVVDYATLTWKQGCSGLKCWCKVFIVHTSNHCSHVHLIKNIASMMHCCHSSYLKPCSHFHIIKNIASMMHCCRSSYLKPCSHFHIIKNITSMMHCWRATIEAKRIKKKKRI
jgi:hypothetical protein